MSCRSRRAAAAALAEGSGAPPPRAQMASSHLSLSGTCPPAPAAGGRGGAAGAPWAWTPAWPCLGSSLCNSFFLLAPPVPRWSVPSQRAEKGPEGHVPGSGLGIVSLL